MPQDRLRAVCEHAEALKRIASNLGFTYRGESYAAFGENLRLSLCKRRRNIPQKVKDLVLKKHDYRCASPDCGKKLEAVEFNHIIALADSKSNDTDNIQPLSPPCHEEKIRAQRLTTFANAWYSELSADTMNGLIEPRKRQLLVFGDGKTNCIELDVIKCRRWAIERQRSLCQLPASWMT